MAAEATAVRLRLRYLGLCPPRRKTPDLKTTLQQYLVVGN